MSQIPLILVVMSHSKYFGDKDQHNDYKSISTLEQNEEYGGIFSEVSADEAEEELEAGKGGDGLGEGACRPRLYTFNPGAAIPVLRIYTSMTSDGELKATVTRSALVITTNEVGKNEWWYVHTCGFEGWTHVGHIYGKSYGGLLYLEPRDQIRVHEAWRGNNYFFLGGNIMLGSDAKLLIVSNILLILPSLVFLWYVLPEFSTLLTLSEQESAYHFRSDVPPATYDDHFSPHAWAAIVYMHVLLTFTLTNLWLTALTDPGILPRTPRHTKPAVPPEAQEALRISSATGVPITPTSAWKYCQTCNIYRPPRAKHCKACDNCVLAFDHHCPWTGGCVAQRNYVYFFRFLVGATLLTFSTLICSGCVMYMQVMYHQLYDHNGGGASSPHRGSPRFMDDDNVSEAVTSGLFDSPTTIFTAIITFVSIWSLASLLSYHCYLVSIGETTNENLRDTFSGSGTPNPWNRGYFGNLAGTCCAEQTEVRIPDQTSTMEAAEYMRELLPMKYHAALES